MILITIISIQDRKIIFANDGTIGLSAYTAGVLTTDVNGVVSVNTSMIDGSGTAGRIPKFSDSNTLTNSRIFESATGTYIHDSDSTTPLQVTKGGTKSATLGKRIKESAFQKG